MTLEELNATDKPYVTASDIAEILGADAQTIRKVAKEEPEKLGFPVICIKRRVLIPTKPFLLYLCG